MDTTMKRASRVRAGKRSARRNGAPRAPESSHLSVFHEVGTLLFTAEKLMLDVEALADRLVEGDDPEIARLRSMAPAALIAMLAGGCLAVWFAARRLRSRREEAAALTRWEGEGGARRH